MAALQLGRKSAWAGLCATAITGVYIAELHSGRCTRILHTSGYFWALGVAVWVPLFLLFWLPNRGRLLLLVSLFAAYLLFPHVYSIPAAPVEARAIRELREMAGALQMRRKQNPAAGYPLELPQKPSGYLEERFKVTYRPLRSRPDGVNDKFLLEATSPWRKCGLYRSFTATENGRIYFTLEDRPATEADGCLE